MKPTALGPCLTVLAAIAAHPSRADGPGQPGLGHSIHGEAFDEGPRHQAWRMEGMGKIDFAVTTSSPDARFFFNQGVAQLHTFYYFEAERSFRQAAFHDPKCAMAYWGMAMANVNNGGRAAKFIDKAKGVKDGATERERKYIDAVAARYAEGRKDDEQRRDFVHGLEAVVLAHPDDIEAKAFLAWTLAMNTGSNSRVAVHSLIEDVLRVSPLHPGAHHYRIHLWDGNDPAQARASAEAYARAAPGIAHAWHMPGHIYNGLSLWREAACQQEGSARVDHQHVMEHMLLPFQIHNYAHNQHYLIAQLNHLGRAREAIAYARNLVEVPRDPQSNNKDQGWSAQRLGRISLLRTLLRFERWDDVLADAHLDWSDHPAERALDLYGRGIALLQKGLRDPSRDLADKLDAHAAEAAKRKDGDADLIETLHMELRGVHLLAEGKTLEGFDLLTRGAKQQMEKFKGDLGPYPRPFYEVLGRAHLDARNWGLAEACYREILKDRKNSLVPLAGVVEACHGAGRMTELAEAHAQFLAALSHADMDLPCRERIARLAPPAASPAIASAATEPAGAGVGSDSFDRATLEHLGPMLWSPNPAPDFTLMDEKGRSVSLAALRGSNVILAFYLGSACAPCMEQLKAIAKEKEAFDKLETKLLAVSADSSEKNRELLASPAGAGLVLPLLSDPDRGVAKLYRAHDTFEDIPLHGVIFIDKKGSIRWMRTSATPFNELSFLKGEIERVNRLQAAPAATPAAAPRRSEV